MSLSHSHSHLQSHWLDIIGISEDGLEGLSPKARACLESADHIFGAQRHLDLAHVKGTPWPIPFSIAPLLAKKGDKCVALVSNDPFWYGAGRAIADALPPSQWRAWPIASSFSQAASLLGWSLEDVICKALHATPFTHILRDLQHDNRLLLTMRDGEAVKAFWSWLVEQNFTQSRIHILECLGGEKQRHRSFTLSDIPPEDISHPVLVALDVKGIGLPLHNGLDDAHFISDGQMTKSPFRALALRALMPHEGEILWDLGAGTGTISVEWCLSGQKMQAYAVEHNLSRYENIKGNAQKFGLEHRLHPIQGQSLDKIDSLPAPHAIFIGGGATQPLIDAAWQRLSQGGRLVIHAVTFETETLLQQCLQHYGGDMMRIDIAHSEPLGSKMAWQSTRPIVEWRVVKSC